MKWTKCGGKEGPFPPEDSAVLVTKNLVHEAPEVLHHLHDGLFCYPFDTDGFPWSYNVAFFWLPIPTEAECEAWERLRETVKALSSAVDDLNGCRPDVPGSMVSGWGKVFVAQDAVRTALAALEAEKETRND